MDNRGRVNIFSHFLTIGLGTLINMCLGLITTPIITRMIDPSEYGALSIFNMYVGIAVMVLCLGLDQALVRFYYDKDTIEYHSGLLKQCLVYPILFSIVCCTLFLMVINITGFEFTGVVIWFLCGSIVISIVQRMALLLLRITYKSRMYACANIVQKLVYIIISIVGLSIFKHGYFEILVFSTFVSILASTIFSVLCTKEVWNFKKVEQVSSKELIKYGAPFILSMGLTTVFQALDKISLNHYCSYNEVGIYSSTMTLVNVFAIIQTSFNALWGPMQVEHYVKHPNDTRFIQKGNQNITVIMFFIGINLILAKDCFVWLLGEKYRAAAYILPVLIFNPIMYTVSETTCAGIGVSKKSYLNIIVSLGACLANLLGNFLLVPRLGGKGAAISTGIAYIVFWAMRTYFSNKYYYVDYHIKKYCVITIVTMLYALYNTFFEFSIFSVLLYVICIVVLLLLYWSVCYQLVCWSWQQIKDLFRRRSEC